MRTFPFLALCGVVSVVLGFGMMQPVVAAPSQVWVNAAWAPGACAEHTWGVDAFSTLQAAIDAVADNGIVTVARGTYRESVTIARSLTLEGPFAGVSPNAPTALDPFTANPLRGSLSEEALLLPPTANTRDGAIITVNANDVTIDGLLLDGHNPQLSGGVLMNGFEAHCAIGINHPNGPIQRLLVTNTIVRNCVRNGIRVYNGNRAATPATGLMVVDNRIENVDDVSGLTEESVGPAISFEAECYGTISENTVMQTCRGIKIGNGRSAAQSRQPAVANNRISASVTGILINLIVNEYHPIQVLVSGNTVQIRDDGPTLGHPRIGIALFSIELHATAMVTNNVVTGGDAGFMVWCCPPVQQCNVSLDNNRVNAAGYGLWVTNYHPYYHASRIGEVQCLVRNLTVDHPRVAGGLVESLPQGDMATRCFDRALIVLGPQDEYRVIGTHAVVE